MEAVWIQLCIRFKHFLVGTLYRPPTDGNLYDGFVSFFNKNWTQKRNIIFLADFNSDLMAKNSNSHSGRRLEGVLHAFDFKNIIKEPTCIINSTEVLIDQVTVSNQIEKNGKISPCGAFEPQTWTKGYETTSVFGFSIVFSVIEDIQSWLPLSPHQFCSKMVPEYISVTINVLEPQTTLIRGVGDVLNLCKRQIAPSSHNFCPGLQLYQIIN